MSSSRIDNGGSVEYLGCSLELLIEAPKAVLKILAEK
jgi:hypothetical protein